MTTIPSAGVTIRWHTPPPTSIDERLVVGPDGRGRLFVFRPRLQRDRVGTYEDLVPTADLAALAAGGPSVDLDLVVPDPAVAAIGVVADRVAAAVRETPLAGARFAVHPLGALTGGTFDLALLVTGEGERPVEFEVLVEHCAVHWGDGTREVGWQPMPAQPIGFMTPDAEGLGGIRVFMIVCSCNVLTDHDVRAAVTATEDLPRSAKQVYGCLGCSAECGRCARTIKTIITEALGNLCAGMLRRLPALRNPRKSRADPGRNRRVSADLAQDA